MSTRNFKGLALVEMTLLILFIIGTLDFKEWTLTFSYVLCRLSDTIIIPYFMTAMNYDLHVLLDSLYFEIVIACTKIWTFENIYFYVDAFITKQWTFITPARLSGRYVANNSPKVGIIQGEKHSIVCTEPEACVMTGSTVAEAWFRIIWFFFLGKA